MLSPAPSWVRTQPRVPRSWEDSPHCRHHSTPRIWRSLVSETQHLFQITKRVLCYQEQRQRTKAGPSTPRILGSLRPVYARDHMGGRSNRASWTGSLQAFIFSQEAELRPRPLGTFPARGELASREGSDPRIRRGIWDPDFCAPSLQEESLPSQSALTTGTQKRVRLPGLLTEANRITGGTSSSQRQIEHLTPEISRWWKANIRILLTETKSTGIIGTQYSHHSESWIPQHMRKARFKFKTIPHDAGRGF